MKQWIVFNGFRFADGLWIHAYVQAASAEQAKQVAVPVFRYMATKHMKTPDLDLLAKFTDTGNYDAICVSGDLTVLV